MYYTRAAQCFMHDRISGRLVSLRSQSPLQFGCMHACDVMKHGKTHTSTHTARSERKEWPGIHGLGGRNSQRISLSLRLGGHRAQGPSALLQSDEPFSMLPFPFTRYTTKPASLVCYYAVGSQWKPKTGIASIANTDTHMEG